MAEQDGQAFEARPTPASRMPWCPRRSARPRSSRTTGGSARCSCPTAKYAPAQGPFGERDDDGFDEVRTQLDEYFAGERTVFDLPLALVGTPFQVRVWEGLLQIPYGQTWSYGQLARSIGLDPRTSSRAVGAANGRNRIAIVVPCHRVIGANGALTGFAAGLDRKRSLLELEHGAPDLLF